MNTHQVLVIRVVVDRKIPGCVTGSLQDNRFASIGTSNFKDAKVSTIFWEIIGIAVAHHGHCGYGHYTMVVVVGTVATVVCHVTKST